MKAPIQIRAYIQLFIVWILFSSFLVFRVTLIRDINEPYAEDGSALILGALASPFNVLKPVVDAVFLIPRLFGAIATTLSLTKAPVILCLLSAGTVSGIAIFAFSVGLRGLVPAFLPRALLSFLIVANVGSREVAGSAQCISYGFSLLLVLLAIAEPSIRSRWLIPLVTILSFSTNSSFVAAPIFGFRYSIKRERVFLLCAAISMAPIPLILFLSTICKSPLSVQPITDISVLLMSFLGQLIFNQLCMPITGGFLAEQNKIVQLSSLFVFYGLYRKLWQSSRKESQVLSAIFLSSAVLYLLAHQLGRPYDVAGSVLDFKIGTSRAEFLLIPIVVIGWTVLIYDSQWLNSFRKNCLFGFIISVQILTTISHSRMSFQEPTTRSWRRFAEELTAARQSPGGSTIADAVIGPNFEDGVPWGLIHCDTSASEVIRCEDLRGNREGVVYEIKR